MSDTYEAPKRERWEKPITMDLPKIEEYQAQHGEDRANGYLDGMTYMMEHLDYILTGVNACEHGWSRTTASKVRTLLTKFEEEQRLLLDKINYGKQMATKATIQKESPQL